MLNILREYFSPASNYNLPRRMQALILSSVSEESLRLETVYVSECGDNQLLARVNAVLACASDNKLIDQGQEHPLMHGWDVSKYPIVIDHEGSLSYLAKGGVAVFFGGTPFKERFIQLILI